MNISVKNRCLLGALVPVMPVAWLTRASAMVAIVCGIPFAFPLYGQTPKEQAWTILQAGATDNNSEQRGNAMRAVQLLPGNAKAVTLAEKGLQDSDPSVRSTAALSLGAMKSKSSIPKLLAALKDDEGEVVLTASAALVKLGNNKGYSAYYAILTGQRKSGEGLVGGEEKEINQIMKNPEQMADMGLEIGMGFVPFGGVARGAFQAVHSSQDKAQIVKATAVRTLANDPDPHSERALVAATKDKSWLVRAAAFDALARRGDPKVLPEIQSGLSDEKDVVKLTAAAAIIHLSKPSESARP
jgi:HEAT repeat protein